jgi:hypothetical protein
MILKYSKNNESSFWSFADGITFITVDKNPLQEKDDNFTCSVTVWHGEKDQALYFRKENAVYLLNDEGKTIECLN